MISRSITTLAAASLVLACSACSSKYSDVYSFKKNTFKAPAAKATDITPPIVPGNGIPGGGAAPVEGIPGAPAPAVGVPGAGVPGAAVPGTGVVPGLGTAPAPAPAPTAPAPVTPPPL
jgi:hypothetical protein